MASTTAALKVGEAMGYEHTTTPTSHLHAKKPDGSPILMRALTWHGKTDVRMQDVPKPAITHPEDAIIKITGTTVCGSDGHLYHGEILQLKAGDILGHECVGIVESVGAEVTKVKPGDRVVPSFSIACGKCHFCRQELYTACEGTNSSSLEAKLYGKKTSGILGYSHLLGGYAGCQAEFVRIPFADTGLLKVDKSPEELPDEKLILMADVMPTSYHAVMDSGFKGGETCVIFGAGPIGLCIAQWLKVLGAKRIIVLDTVPNRLEFARSKLGVEALNVNDHGGNDGTAKKLMELEPHGWDIVWDAAGFRYAKNIIHKAMRALSLETDTPEVLNAAIRVARPFGTVEVIADYVGVAHGFNVGAMMEKGIRLHGSGQAPAQKYVKTILEEYVLTGKFDTSLLVTHRFDIEELPALYHASDKKRETFNPDTGAEIGIIKAFVQTPASHKAAKGTPELSRVPGAGAGGIAGTGIGASVLG